MKNRKIISLISALAMVFSMFSAFTVVNAENTKGIGLTGALSEDGTKITLDAAAVGTTGALANFMIAVNVPDGVTKDDVTYTAQAGVGLTKNVSEGVLYLAFNDSTGEGVVFADDKLATITINLASPLRSDYVVTLQGDAAIRDENGSVKVSRGDMDATSTTVAKWVDPNKKPDTVARPTEEVEPPAPVVPDPVDPVGKGIALEASLDKTNTVLTVNATAVGTTGALANFMIAVNVPDGVTKDDVTYTAQAGVGLTKNVSEGVLYLAFNDSTGEGVVFADDKLATITINLGNTPLTSAYAVTLQGDAAIRDENGSVKVSRNDMTATSAVAMPSEDKPKPTKTVALKDFVASDAGTAIAAVPEGKAVYMTVDVKLADGNDAAYGADYTAVYKGVELSEAAFKNLIHGYTDENMVDIINGVTFNIYNSNVKKIATTLNAEDQEEQLTQPVDKDIVSGSDPGNKSAKGKIASNVTKSIKADAGKQTATFTVTPAKDKDGNSLTEGTVVFNVEKDSFDAITASAFTISCKDAEGKTASVTATITDADQDIELPVSADNKYSVAFTPAAKGTVKYTMTYTDANGDTSVATVKYTISAASSPDNGGGGKNTSSGTGAIANGILETTGDYAFATFTDLGDADWARTAITTLALRNIVSGRGDNTFDPNGNITRAEYAQILVNAIGKGSESADVQFDDVPTDAWFYHNVAVAAKYEIISGYGDGNFGPYDLITREQMALMTMKAAQVMNVNLAGGSVGQFTDNASISDWANEAVYTLANVGIINGMGDGTFAPKNNATRAQAATIIYNTFVK